MGASSSADGTILKKKKVYKRLEPEKREKTRFDPLEHSNFTSQHDASIDKVKYASNLHRIDDCYTVIMLTLSDIFYEQ